MIFKKNLFCIIANTSRRKKKKKIPVETRVSRMIRDGVLRDMADGLSVKAKIIPRTRYELP